MAQRACPGVVGLTKATSPGIASWVVIQRDSSRTCLRFAARAMMHMSGSAPSTRELTRPADPPNGGLGRSRQAKGRQMARLTRLDVTLRLRLCMWMTILCVLLLLGCWEVRNEYYISNHTEVDLAVRLTPLYMDTVDLSSGPLVENIQKRTRSSLQQSVSFEEQGGTLAFTVGAKTTVFLGTSSGGRGLFSELEITSRDQHLAMDGEDYREYFTVQDHLVGAVVQVLNVR